MCSVQSRYLASSLLTGWVPHLQASASDADSSQARATPDTLALMCAGEAMSPESSDDEDAARAAADAPQPCSAGGPLQPLPGATLAAVPATGAARCHHCELYRSCTIMDAGAVVLATRVL